LHDKSAVLSVLFLAEGTIKKQLDPAQKSKGEAAVLSHVICLEILDQDRPVCWSIVIKEKPTAGPPFF
jgi:hypothetical protein